MKELSKILVDNEAKINAAVTSDKPGRSPAKQSETGQSNVDAGKPGG